MKLETKHLAAYAPYKVKVLLGDIPRDLTGMSFDSPFVYVTFYCGASEKQMANIESIKPILHTLSDLKKFAKEIKALGYRTDENNFLNLQNDIKGNGANYDFMELCFKNHIDVFELIDAGLAVDINTIK